MIYVLSKESFNKKLIPKLNSFNKKILIFARCPYPNFITKGQSKKEVNDQLTWYTTFFSENYNEGGLNTVYGFASLSEGRLREL